MSTATLVLLAFALVLAVFGAVRDPACLKEAAANGGRLGLRVLLRLPIALALAGFVADLLPRDLVLASIGEQSGFSGIAIASILGSLIPGGPMISFPIALSLFGAGAGIPQAVAFLTGWSVVGVHRLLAYEVPLLGPSFALLRLASVAILPLAAGGLALFLAPILLGPRP